MRFRAEIPNTYVLKSTALEGKKVRIAADATLDNATVVALVEGNALTPETDIFWKPEQTAKTTFVGLYHDLESGDAPVAPEDLKQEYGMVSGEGAHDYAYHSTYLTATAKDVTPETTVNLAFKHPFSKLGVTVTNDLTDGFTVKGVVLKDIVTKGTLDFAAETVELGTEKLPVPAALVDGKYSAIILPQAAKLAIYVTVGKEGNEDREYAFTLTASNTFAANKSYSANVKLTDETVVGEAVGFAFTVADWEDAGTLETEELVPEEPKWVVIGKLNGKTWEEPAVIDMVKDEYGNWSADITYAEGDEFKLKCEDTWAGMQSGWTFYGLGDFGNDSNYLSTANTAVNIVLEDAGDYNLFFAPSTNWFIVTAVTPEP